MIWLTQPPTALARQGQTLFETVWTLGIVDAQRQFSAKSPPTPITLVWWMLFALTLLMFRKSCYSKALAHMPKHQLLIVAVTLCELSLEFPLTLTLSNDLGRPWFQSFWFWNSKCSKHGIYQRWAEESSQEVWQLSAYTNQGLRPEALGSVILGVQVKPPSVYYLCYPGQVT